MSHLSESLQSQLTLAVTGNVLKQFPLFEAAEEKFLAVLAKACRTQRAGCGDVVVREEESASEMFWVVRGEALIIRRGVPIGSLRAGDWFGELSLFVPGAVRTATVRSETHCEFLVLDQQKYLDRIQSFPRQRREYEKVVQQIRLGNPSS